MKNASLKRPAFQWKFFHERLAKVLMIFCVSIVGGSLFLLLGTILYRGLPSLSWEMVSEVPQGGFYLGGSGGILNAIVGSLYLAVGATLIAIILGLPTGLMLNFYLKRTSKRAAIMRLVLNTLWGVPSIVYGAFAIAIMIAVGAKASVLAGIVIVGLLVTPVFIRAIDEVFRLVPRGLIDATLSLGAPRWEVVSKVVIRQTIPGLITATLLSFGRSIGDAAAVLFTAGYTDHIPRTLGEPAATLPLAIFFQLGSPAPVVQERAYAAALVLTLILLVISLLTRMLTRRSSSLRIDS